MNVRTCSQTSALPFKLMLKHREALWQFTRRNVELQHKGSFLGWLWAVLQPLCMLFLYVFVFGYVFGGSFKSGNAETKMDYALGIFTGLSLFHFLGEILATSPSVIIQNPNLVKKVIFPLEILPAATVGAALLHFIVSFALLVLGVCFLGPGITLSTLWLPVILLPLIFIGLGLAWGISAIGVYFRDIISVVGVLSLALMFSSAVFYSSSEIPEGAWRYLKYNPLIHAIEMSRSVLIWNEPFDIGRLAYLYFAGVLTLFVGYSIFRKTRYGFADVL